MNSLSNPLKNDLARLSPLYEYWNSSQNDELETLRLSKINEKSPASILFKNEPYKWENLFQSIIREIINGEIDSIKGLKVLLDTITKKERDIVISKLSNDNIFCQNVLDLVNSKRDYIPKKAVNRLRFLRILSAIFFNRYDLEIKRKKNHVYEYTGFLVYSIKNSFSKF
tara:strand:+ start:1364 stop:1870 length:507 start_codon:yes stop_codon:yes gene_type:complete